MKKNFREKNNLKEKKKEYKSQHKRMVVECLSISALGSG